MGVMRLLASELYGVTTHDPSTYLGAALLIVAASAVATWFPARRATRVEPMTVLRTE
jgi:ABC-type lipoprotein release transport system permease subunit